MTFHFSIAYHADDGKVFMGSGVGGELRKHNEPQTAKPYKS